MDKAFEQAMSDWKAMGGDQKAQEAEAQADATETAEAAQKEGVETEGTTTDGIEDRGAVKGQLDHVWDSLTSDAARQDKLAEWEKDFSQVRRELLRGPS